MSMCVDLDFFLNLVGTFPTISWSRHAYCYGEILASLNSDDQVTKREEDRKKAQEEERLNQEIAFRRRVERRREHFNLKAWQFGMIIALAGLLVFSAITLIFSYHPITKNSIHSVIFFLLSF